MIPGWAAEVLQAWMDGCDYVSDGTRLSQELVDEARALADAAASAQSAISPALAYEVLRACREGCDTIDGVPLTPAMVNAAKALDIPPRWWVLDVDKGDAPHIVQAAYDEAVRVERALAAKEVADRSGRPFSDVWEDLPPEGVTWEQARGAVESLRPGEVQERRGRVENLSPGSKGGATNTALFEKVEAAVIKTCGKPIEKVTDEMMRTVWVLADRVLKDYPHERREAVKQRIRRRRKRR